MTDPAMHRIYYNTIWSKKGNIIRTGRVYKGWNRQRVATMVGLKEADIRRFEQGEEEIPKTLTKSFEEILGVRL